MAEPAPIRAMLEQAASKWRTCEEVPESDLLRLCVLRDLLHGLHAQKSRFLSQGKGEDALSIRGLEARIEELRSGKPLAGELSELLESQDKSPDKLKKGTRVLPDALFAAIDREKLERYDRQWEAAIASEALSRGWRLWSLEAEIEIARIDEWNRRLVESLWPDGIVLYVESAGPQGSRAGGEAGPSGPEPAWLGRWVCLLHPRFGSSAEIPLDFAKWPGTRRSPAWRVLFSPGPS